MSEVSHPATYERARRLANLAIWTVALQKRRLRTAEPEDGEFIFRKWADFQFLIVALTRLRRAAVLAAKIPTIASELNIALKEFDSALPVLKKQRDVAEHFDDYALDRGRHDVRRQSLEVGIISETKFQWLGSTLDTEIALKASQRLFEAIKKQSNHFRADENADNEI